MNEWEHFLDFYLKNSVSLLLCWCWSVACTERNFVLNKNTQNRKYVFSYFPDIFHHTKGHTTRYEWKWRRSEEHQHQHQNRASQQKNDTTVLPRKNQFFIFYENRQTFTSSLCPPLLVVIITIFIHSQPLLSGSHSVFILWKMFVNNNRNNFSSPVVPLSCPIYLLSTASLPLLLVVVWSVKTQHELSYFCFYDHYMRTEKILGFFAPLWIFTIFPCLRLWPDQFLFYFSSYHLDIRSFVRMEKLRTEYRKGKTVNRMKAWELKTYIYTHGWIKESERKR